MLQLSGVVTVMVIGSVLAIAGAMGEPELEPLSSRKGGFITYFLDAGIVESGVKNGDLELAEWALREWERESAGAVQLRRVASEQDAIVRLYWLPPVRGGQMAYTTTPTRSPRRSASIFIRPNLGRVRPAISKVAAEDKIFRDVVVYFLCLHEAGHALGLVHSENLTDIMGHQSNQDALANFTRLRTLVKSRADISTRRWLSANDVARIRSLYKK